MAKTEAHYLEYVERNFLYGTSRAVCSCGAVKESDTEDGARTWHADHVKAEAEKAEKRTRAASA